MLVLADGITFKITIQKIYSLWAGKSTKQRLAAVGIVRIGFSMKVIVISAYTH